MLDLSTLLIDGALLTIIFSLFVVGSLLWKPRLWLQDFPPDLQARIPPKTEEEKRQTALIGIPFFIILFGGLGLAAAHFGAGEGFGWLFLHVYLVWQMVNLFDLLVIDWGGMQLIDPQNPPFPGTEGAAGYRAYRFHFTGFLKGSLMGLPLALIVGGAVWLLR